MHVRIFLVGVLFVGVMAFPLVSRAMTNDEILQQIAQLLAHVKSLQAQLQAVEGGATTVGPIAPGGVQVGVSVSACVNVTRTLARGDENDEVRALQSFLAKDPSVYPEGVISGYYGRLTERAVQRWQARNGVVSSGTPATTGYGVIGPATRRALAQGCSGASNNPAVERDLVVTPVVGQLPLQVTATFSLNSSSCSSYQLDWGDGTEPISFNAGTATNCTKDIAHKRATHTYTIPGKHQIVLRAGRGSLTQVQLVSSIVVSVGETAPTSFSLNPVSGSAPFTTSITFPVVGSNCTSYEVEWGDGEIDYHEARQQTGCLSDSGTQAITHTYTEQGDYTVRFKVGRIPLEELEFDKEWSVQVRGDVTEDASISIDPTTGPAPLTIALQMRAEGGACVSYFLDWGDDSDTETLASSQTGCDGGTFWKDFEHTYKKPGIYVVKTKLGSEAPLEGLPLGTQPIVVNDGIAGPGAACVYSTKPVCGEVINECPVGQTCSRSFKTFTNRCLLEAEGSVVFLHAGSCANVNE